MTREDEIRERLAKATPGPWEWDVDLCIMLAGHEGEDSVVGVRLAPRPFDADFIAHSREDVPYLLDQLSALQARVDAAVNFKHQDCGSCVKNGVYGVTHIETTVDDILAILTNTEQVEATDLFEAMGLPEVRFPSVKEGTNEE